MARIPQNNRKHHGLSGTPEHSSWCSMRERCNNQCHPSYARYGGRGISVCAQWDSFLQFLEDVGPRPTTKHSIDRIDVNGNYEPSNCRWSTAKEQANNRCNNRHLIIDGVAVPHKEASAALGVGYSGLRRQSAKPNFSLGEYLARPKKAKITGQHVANVRSFSAAGMAAKDISIQVGISKAKVVQILNGKNSKWEPFNYDRLEAA